MKKSLSVCLLLLSFLAKGQLKVIAESPVFDEPEHGYVSLRLLKDGSTLYLHRTPKHGIHIRLYDAQHKEIVAKKLEADFGNLSEMSLEGIYEIGNNLTFFVSETKDKVPTLYQFLLNKQDASIGSLKTLATLNEVKRGQDYASAFGGVPVPSFEVCKDVLSDSFAVVRFNSFESDRNKRIELIQFSPDGTETGRVFVSSPEGKYKYTELLDCLLLGEEAYLLLYSYNTPSSGGAENELLLATVKNNNVVYTNVGKSISRRIQNGDLSYNSKTGDLIFATVEPGSTRVRLNSYAQNYYVGLNIVDRQTGTIKKGVSLQHTGFLPKFRRVFKNDDGFSLGYDGYTVNDDGTFTLKMEYSLVVEYINHQTGSSRSTTTLGPSGVITYDSEGKEMNAALIPKSQTLAKIMFSGEIVGTGNMNGGNQFKGIYFLKMNSKSYVLLNDVEENAERVKKGRLTDIRGLGDCEAWQYDLTTTVSSSLPIPQRTLLFPKAKEKERNMVLFAVSDLDFEKNIFVTVKVNKNKANLVWMTE